jgi:hypothetical protein
LTLHLALAHSTFANLKKQAVAENLVEQRDKAWFRTPKAHSFNVMTGGTRRCQADRPIRAAI